MKAPPFPSATITIERDGVEVDVAVHVYDHARGAFQVDCDEDLTSSELDDARDALCRAMDHDPATLAYRADEIMSLVGLLTDEDDADVFEFASHAIREGTNRSTSRAKSQDCTEGLQQSLDAIETARNWARDNGMAVQSTEHDGDNA